MRGTPSFSPVGSARISPARAAPADGCSIPGTPPNCRASKEALDVFGKRLVVKREGNGVNPAAASNPRNWHTCFSQLWRNRVQNCGFLLIGFGARGTKRDPVHGPPRPREPAGGGSEGCNRPNSAVIVSACRRQRCPPRCHPTDSRPAWPCGTPLQLRRANGWAIPDRKSTRLNSSHLGISYAVFCLK